jgi:hypothetical protein
MKAWAILGIAWLASSLMSFLFHPTPSIVSLAIGTCLLVLFVVGWSCAIRERSFSIFGMTDLKFRKPFISKLTGSERIAAQIAVAVLLGVLCGVTASVTLN